MAMPAIEVKIISGPDGSLIQKGKAFTFKLEQGVAQTHDEAMIAVTITGVRTEGELMTIQGTTDKGCTISARYNLGAQEERTGVMSFHSS